MSDFNTGKKIKELRIEKGLSQQSLAENCGISRSNLNRIENGKGEASIETLLKLSKVLGPGLIGSHMANNRNESDMLTQYVDDLGKKDFDVFYGLIEHVCENYCENNVDPKITLVNNHFGYDDLRDLLIDVVKSRLNYYSKQEK